MSVGIWHFINGVGGGLSGAVTSSVYGSSEDGVHGFMRGFSWGAIGLIRKPVAGVHDLAAGTASTMHDTSPLTPGPSAAGDDEPADAPAGAASHNVRTDIHYMKRAEVKNCFLKLI